jgi:hypothetical protein
MWANCQKSIINCLWKFGTIFCKHVYCHASSPLFSILTDRLYHSQWEGKGGGDKAAAIIQNLCYGGEKKKTPADTAFLSVKVDKCDLPLN